MYQRNDSKCSYRSQSLSTEDQVENEMAVTRGGSNSKSKPPPAPHQLHHIIRKSLLASWRDFSLTLSHRRHTKQCLIFLLFSLILFFILLHTLSRSSSLIHPYPAHCYCQKGQNFSAQSQLLARIHYVKNKWVIHTLYKGSYTSVRSALVFPHGNNNDDSPCVSTHQLKPKHHFLLTANSYNLSISNQVIILSSSNFHICYSPLPSSSSSLLSSSLINQNNHFFQPDVNKYQPGVSIIAACKDRTDTLNDAFSSWKDAKSISQIILVDWSSSPPISINTTHDNIDILLVRVNNRRYWSLTHAYNVAMNYVTFDKILKVDCDTHIHSEFITHHPIHSLNSVIYAGNHTVFDFHNKNNDQLHANGVLFIASQLLLSIGGYDERIVTYGWDDSDILYRLQKRSRKLQHHIQISPLNLNYMKHIQHASSRRLSHSSSDLQLLPASHPLATAVEIQRNRLLITKCNLPKWTDSIPHTKYTVSSVSSNYYQSQSQVQMSVIESTQVMPAFNRISKRKLNEMNKKALRIILRRFGISRVSRKSPLNFTMQVINALENPRLFASVMINVSQLGILSSALSIAVAMHCSSSIKVDAEFVDWRIHFELNEQNNCLFDDVFDFPPFEYVQHRPHAANQDEKERNFMSMTTSSSGLNIRQSFQRFQQVAKVIEEKPEDEMKLWTSIGINDEHRKNLKNEHIVDLNIKQCDMSSIIQLGDSDEIEKERYAIRTFVKPSDKVVSTITNTLLLHRYKKHIEIDDFTIVHQFGSRFYNRLLIQWDHQDLKSMAAKWSGSSADVNSHLVESLLRRAQSIVYAVSLHSHWNTGKGLSVNGHPVSNDVKQAILRLSNQILYLFDYEYDHLHEGGSTSNLCKSFSTTVVKLMTKAPEIAIVAAALLSTSTSSLAPPPSLSCLHRNHPHRHHLSSIDNS